MPKPTILHHDDLKARIAAAAERAGMTADAFMLDAIKQAIEQDNDFHRIADERWAKILATGMTASWEQSKAYLEARSREERPGRPIACKPARS